MAAKPAQKPTAKGKHPAPAKHPAPTNAHLQGEVASLQRAVKKLQSEIHPNKKHTPAKPKHSAAKHPAKHAPAAKHGNAPAKGGTAKGTAKGGAAKRGLALPGGIACCTAEGLAASLRLTGKRVGADDVLALYHLTPGADETGASILATLAAAQRFGLAGAYPTWRPALAPVCGVVAGITLPYGGHTVTVDRGGVWTWGEWRPVRAQFADAIEEAWVITWQ